MLIEVAAIFAAAIFCADLLLKALLHDRFVGEALCGGDWSGHHFCWPNAHFGVFAQANMVLSGLDEDDVVVPR